jgi:ribosomal protein L37AE/L43A
MEYKMSREEFWQMIKEQKQNMKCDFCGNKGIAITTKAGSWICRKCFERVVEEGDTDILY